MIDATPRRGRDQSRLNLIDYALMGLGASLAAFTAGMSIGRTDTAEFLAIGVLMGTALAYLMRSIFANTSVVRVDGILYAAAVACAIIGQPVLNGFLPEEGFARDVMMAGILAWMLVLGSVLAWRDGTLLFQAIPSVALFGLVGCYDTYVYAPYLFFGFLVCLAIVLARANRREMMRQAVMSGYFNRADAPSTPQQFPEQSPELYEDIRRGPWRWLAGPEWALASALLIVLLSGIGAPVLQEAAKPITGAVRIIAPQSIRRTRGANDRAQETSYVVGRGPNGNLSDRVLYNATLDRPRYMRTAAYEVYTGRGWRTMDGPDSVAGTFVGDSVDASIQAMGEQKTLHPYSVTLALPARQLPLPAEPLSFTGRNALVARVRRDGGGAVNAMGLTTVSGNLAEATRIPQDVVHDMPDGASYYDASGVRPRVAEFARNAARGETDDYTRARAVSSAIARQVKYNILADAVPGDADPAEWFLFTNREGYCDLFATAMTLSARSLGMPARYVIGYLPESQLSDGDGHYVLREADYHAWCEVFFKGVGWVVFDSTEGAEQVEGGERGSSDSGRPWYDHPLVANGARIFLGVVALVAGYYALVSLRPKPRPPRWQAHRAYAAFERAIRKAIGRRRAPGETIEAYVRAAEPTLGVGVVALGQRFGLALYGATDPTGEEIKALREGIQALKAKR